MFKYTKEQKVIAENLYDNDSRGGWPRWASLRLNIKQSYLDKARNVVKDLEAKGFIITENGEYKNYED